MISFKVCQPSGTSSASPLLAAHWLHTVHLLKVPAVNGAVLAVTIFSQIQVVLSCVLLGATIFWTCIKIAKALRDFHGKE